MNGSDVQSREISKGFRLARVGIRGSKKPIVVERPSKVVHLTATIDAFVDLPANQKGSHLSRNVEVINETVERRASKPVSSLEELACDICQSLLDRHDYAQYAETRITADYFLERKTPSGRRSIESYKITGGAMLHRGKEEEDRKSIAVYVQGMTVCPCAVETLREDLMRTRDLDRESIEHIPLASHNQRNNTILALTLPLACVVEADDLIEIVEGSLSSPTYEMLKRPDEAEIVRTAHLNPRFVEDVVREVLRRIVERYGDLPTSVLVEVESESEESIHKHNAFASRTATMGDLVNSEE